MHSIKMVRCFYLCFIQTNVVFDKTGNERVLKQILLVGLNVKLHKKVIDEPIWFSTM